MTKTPNIDYTEIDFNQILDQLKTYLQNTETFKDYNFDGSNISTIMELVAYVGALNSFYVNNVANELYTPTAKLYSSLNKLAKLADYDPRGFTSSNLDTVMVLDNNYVIGNDETSFKIPSYSEIPTDETDDEGNTIKFATQQDIIYNIKGYGLDLINIDNIMLGDYTFRDIGGMKKDDLLNEGLVKDDPSSINHGELWADKISLKNSEKNPFVFVNNDEFDTIRDKLEIGNHQTLNENEEYSLLFESDGNTPSLNIGSGQQQSESEVLRFEYSYNSEDKLEITITRNFSQGNYYIGYLGIRNLHETLTEIHTVGDRLEEFHLHAGQKPLKIMIDGLIYTWTEETISSGIINEYQFENVISDLNIIMKVGGNPSGEFISELKISDAEPGVNEALIGKIPFEYVDGDGNIVIDNVEDFKDDLLWVHGSESLRLENLKEGVPRQSLIFESGQVSADVDELDLTYNPNNGKYTFGLDQVSEDDIRVFVKEGNEVREWFHENSYDVNDIGSDTRVFYTRVNPNEKLQLWFGDDDYRGRSPRQNRVNIIGMRTAGGEGNVSSDGIKDVVNITNFSGKIFKTQKFFEKGGVRGSSLTDENNNDVVFEFKKGYGSVGGANLETIEELRNNIGRTVRAQNSFVSENDYKDLLQKEFGDILADVRVTNYSKAQDIGIITETEAEKFYFNSLFIVTAPRKGINLLQYEKEQILDLLRSDTNVMVTVTHSIIDAELIPIDVLVKYSKDLTKSASVIESNIENKIYDFFDRNKRSIGETIHMSDVVEVCKVEGTTSVEVMLNKDVEDQYDAGDYDRDIPNDLYTGEKSKEHLKATLLNRLEKEGLLEKYQPLFDIEGKPDDITGKTERSWTQSGNVAMEPKEFPILGDIIIEQET